ncbi:interferon-induced very large GTPase 1-like [Mixophyes fleayi]|uniref:interferon-induced very large GTPase 1-like n=1 Tax=Mixophyes fleayi TaxID=3061075 RepID=UPI003F4D9D9C
MFVDTLHSQFMEVENQSKAIYHCEEYRQIRGIKRNKKWDFGDAEDAAVGFSPLDKFRITTFLPIIDQLLTSINHRQSAYSVIPDRFGFLTELCTLSSDDLHAKASALMEVYSEVLVPEYADEVVQFAALFKIYDKHEYKFDKSLLARESLNNNNDDDDTILTEKPSTQRDFDELSLGKETTWSKDQHTECLTETGGVSSRIKQSIDDGKQNYKLDKNLLVHEYLRNNDDDDDDKTVLIDKPSSQRDFEEIIGTKDQHTECSPETGDKCPHHDKPRSVNSRIKKSLDGVLSDNEKTERNHWYLIISASVIVLVVLIVYGKGKKKHPLLPENEISDSFLDDAPDNVISSGTKHKGEDTDEHQHSGNLFKKKHPLLTENKLSDNLLDDEPDNVISIGIKHKGEDTYEHQHSGHVFNKKHPLLTGKELSDNLLDDEPDNEISIGIKHKGEDTYKHQHLDLLSKAKLIDQETEKFPEKKIDVKLTFLRKLMALDRTARCCSLDFLDVLCDVLKPTCTDKNSQQDIVSKMTMLQFSVPLLLPAGDGTDCTFMLWAMRDIVKRWRPLSSADSKGFSEDNLVNIYMPFFSFVRLGKCNISKSKILNQVLSPDSQNHNYHVHRDMDGENIVRETSDGLVEICWYLPSGQGGLDTFTEPIAVTNLRGDLEAHNKQFNFLSWTSSAMFIFVESINERQYELLSKLHNENTEYFLVINASDGKPGEETMTFLKDLLTSQKVKKQNVIIKNRNINESQIVIKLQTAMNRLIKNNPKILNLEQIANKATEFKINVDESNQDCEETKLKALEIIREIQDIAHYKRQTMKLQGDLWKQLTKTEKECCRMRELADRDAEEYKSQLQTEIIDLRKQQSEEHMPKGIETFLREITHKSSVKKQLFLKYLKISLDTLGRRDLSVLQAEYRDRCKDLSVNACELKNIDQRIADNTLGVEHFLRELGQFYEAERFMENTRENNFERQCNNLPGIAADLLLDGFPLELINGDASNIPLQWITDVLTELDNKTGGHCRMRVITVLGVQSTGKSTLLNTMFGLQFPVASGRCTRGAFMTLIKVKETFQEELGCDFILVIDTEGLKSLELASLEGSYEHDNELATLVIGLSDITIVNMAMENTEEMKDILQIVVHAFLRMKEVGKKPNCQFVHHNVSDVSAHVKNRKSRQKFLEQLNEMTKVAAKMEKRSDISTFSDIIYCDLEKHSWYIPGLWHGIPPMASVNFGYSENIKKVKKSIIETLQSMPGKPQTIAEFTEWIKSLWNAVKHEKFVFSFRNQLVTEAYNQLCIQYSDWEWRFQKSIHHWMLKTETLIYNLPYDKLGANSWNNIKDEMYQLLNKGERVMSQSLEEYFEGDYDNAHLLEMFRGDFFRSVKYIRKELEHFLIDKCEKTYCIQKEKCQIQAMQAQYIDIVEEKVTDILEAKRKIKCILSFEQLDKEFETMWRETLATLQLSKLEKRNIDHIIILHLKQDMKCDDGSINNKLHNIFSLNEYKQNNFVMIPMHLCSKSSERMKLAGEIAVSLLNKCDHYVTECVSKKEDFNEIFSKELLKIINKRLNNHDVISLQTTKVFELDVKLHILGSAAWKFQKMHNDFVQKNDPSHCLQMLKPEYFSMFHSVFEKRNECQRRAEQFCDLCLKPAIIDHINKYLGKEIVEDILQISGPQEFKSRKRFQCLVLQKLLNRNSCQQYVEYINNYESFVTSWISQYILEHYNGQGHVKILQVKILSSLTAKLQKALNHTSPLQAEGVSDYLAKFCSILQKELVISQNNLKVVAFQSDLDIKKFAYDVGSYLYVLEEQIKMDINSRSAGSVLSQVTLKPQEELVNKVIGCGKQCPFCKAPCEAGGGDHKEHFASLHRPRGLAQHKDEQTEALDHSICSTNVISNKCFSNADTEWKPHPYKDYRTYYPDWAIYPDMTADASDYWKFVFKKFNDSFAEIYNAERANLPEDWYRLTKDHALSSLKTFNN